MMTAMHFPWSSVAILVSYEHMIGSANEISDLFIIVRGVGERTQNSVVALAKELVGSNNVALVSEAPFSKALTASFALATARNFPWTCCIDADILFLPEALVHLRRLAQAASSQLFSLQGMVLDKFFGGLRPAGPHLYRTALLARAQSHIPPTSSSKRPETFVRRVMQQQGYTYLPYSVLVGLHGFEQSYEDVYRTAFFHAQKHRSQLLHLRSYWERMSQHDPDFLVALRGAGDGGRATEVLGLDVRNFTERSRSAVLSLGLSEKAPYQLSPLELISTTERIIASWQTPPEYDATWRQTSRPSLAARLLGPTFLARLGLRDSTY